MKYNFGSFRRTLSFALPVALFFSVGLISTASAHEIPVGVFTVSPVKQEFTLEPGEEKTSVTMLANGTAYPLTVTALYQDIAPAVQGSAEDSPVKLVDESGKNDSLREMIEYPATSFTLLSGGEIEVPITITAPKNINGGGRYGSIVWTFKVATKAGEPKPANVAVESRIASLYFVRIAGETREDGQLVSFGLFNDAASAAQPSSSTPVRFHLSYENKGNVYLNPYGRVTVSGMLSDPKVLTVDPWAVLPAATRMREINLHSPMFPGLYRAHLELNRGYGDIIDEREISFWILPTMTQWLVGLILLILLILLIRRSLRLSRHSLS